MLKVFKLFKKLSDLHFHVWEYLEEPSSRNEAPRKVKCIKCDTVKNKHVDPFKVHRRAYLWCDCHNELFRDSFKQKVVDINTELYVYVCSSCGRISVFNFNIAPVPVEVTDKYDILKFPDGKITLYPKDVPNSK